MTSSRVTDISTQTNQPRSATSKTTSQLRPTQVFQSSTSVPPNLAPPPSQHQGVSRPCSIAELTERAKQCLGYGLLQVAEDARQDAKNFYDQGNLDSAFVKYTVASTIVFENLLAHPDYLVLLPEKERRNVSLVSYFHPLRPHNCDSVGYVRLSESYECIDECISVLLKSIVTI